MTSEEGVFQGEKRNYLIYVFMIMYDMWDHVVSGGLRAPFIPEL
jgi:hypothetical protein